MPDTEDEDSAAEVFWPEGYKQVIRDDVAPFVREQLLKDSPFASVYERSYKNTFADHNQFLDKVAERVAIATENGADDGFDEIINSFLKEAPLPSPRAYARHQEPTPLSDELKQKLRQSIIGEYGKDNIYVYAFGVGYAKTFATFEQYMDYIADLVVTAARNGANDALEKLYRSFIVGGPLPPVRRHPRRLKVW